MTVFISYSRAQLYFAEALAIALKQNGVDVWFDLHNLTPGVDWADTIQSGLERCSGLVLVASRAALASPYVRLEWASAIQNGKPIYVLLFEKVILPPELTAPAAVLDFRRDFDDQLRALKRCVQTGDCRRDAVPAPNRWNFPTVVEPGVRRTGWFLLSAAGISLIVGTLLGGLIGAEVAETPRLIDFLPGILTAGWLFYLYVRFLYRRLGYGTLRLTWALATFAAMLASFVALLLVLIPREDATPTLLTLVVAALFWLPVYLSRSANRGDVLRWMPTGVASDYQRQAVIQWRGQATSGKIIPAVSGQPAQLLPMRAIRYRLHYHPGDQRIADYIAHVLAGHLHMRVNDPAADAAYHLLVVTRATDVPAVLAKLSTTHVTLIPILATSVTTASFDHIKEYQVIDFRQRRRATLEAFAHLISNPSSQMFYGTRITPKKLQGITLPSPLYYAELISLFFVRRLGIAPDTLMVAAPLVIGLLVVIIAFALDRPSASQPVNTPASTVAAVTSTAAPTRPIITMVPITAAELSLALGPGWVFDSTFEPSPITAALRDATQPVLLARKGSTALFSSGADDLSAMTVMVLQYSGAQRVQDYLLGAGATAHDGAVVTGDARLTARLYTLSNLREGLVGWLYTITTPGSSSYVIYIPALPMRFTASVPPPDEVSAVLAGIGLAQP